MKPFDHNQQAPTGAHEPGSRAEASKVLLAVLASSLFMAAAQIGLSAVEAAGIASLQILLDVCQASFVAVRIFAH